MQSLAGQMQKVPQLDFVYLQQYSLQRALGLMWHYSKDPDATKVWLDSLPDDGRDVFLNLPMSVVAYSLKCQNLKVIVKNLKKK